ncbi:MAG: carboxypeptidase regulatory-like domain-containing protein [Bordetella sp.]|uniref:carboxypeptidase regulatory-like domain-containing protein n=1 Tax=Bordetella sp. TaxID=28081 RepID=UPI003F7BEFF9
MKKPSLRVAGTLAAAVLAIAGAMTTAYAQTDGLPTIYSRGQISYTSGGVGQDEEQAFKQQAPNWPLALQFSGAGGQYIADIHLSIMKRDGTKVLEAVSQGPFMLVKLPPGAYTIRAAYKHQKQQKNVNISGHASVAFRWNTQ